MSRAALLDPPAAWRTRASLVILALAGLTLTACQGEPPPPVGGGGATSRSDAATQAACRQHADQVYDQRNRGDIYSPQSSVNTPFSANYNPGVTSRGLSDLYSREALIRDCVRNTGTETNRTVAPSAGAGTGAVVRP
jgi:hypothetical protein